MSLDSRHFVFYSDHLGQPTPYLQIYSATNYQTFNYSNPPEVPRGRPITSHGVTSTSHGPRFERPIADITPQTGFHNSELQPGVNLVFGVKHRMRPWVNI